MLKLCVPVCAIALLGGQAASADPIIIGTVPPQAAPAATTSVTTAAAVPAPVATPAPMATKPAPVASSKPAPEARRVFVAKDTLAPEDGIPVAPDMKSYPNTTAFLAANRLFRSKVATAWSRNQIDAATYHKLMATYRANIQAGKVAGR